MRKLRRLDDPARFRPWAYRIVTNKCADWTRRRVAQRKATAELRSATTPSRSGQPNEADSTGDVARLRHALTQLPDEQRAILSLHYQDGMGITQIAEVLGVPVGTVKSRMFHARNRLRQALERT